MHLTLSDFLIKALVAQGKLDKRLATALASDLLDQKEPVYLATFLLDRDAAMELLAKRLLEAPEQVLRAVEAMPVREAAPPPKRRGRRPGRKKAARRLGRPKKVQAKKAAKPKRRRMIPARTKKLKDKICAFLKANPGSSRSEIIKAARVPGEAIYNRVMGELREAKEVKVKGDRRMARYSLK